MKIIALAVFALFSLAASPLNALAEPRAALDDVLAEATKVQIEAMQIADLLRERDPDYFSVRQQLSFLEQHAEALKEAMDAVDVEAVSLVPADRNALQRARVATDALMALMQNKARLLDDAEQAQRQRGLLRAKARGIASRAGLVKEQVGLVRG